MAGIEFDMHEVRELAATLTDATGVIGARAAQVVKKSAFDLVAEAKYEAPVDTGFLVNSISAEFTGDGRHSEMSAEVGPTASYGFFVEHGTSRMPGQPFLFPAADRITPNFEAAIAQLGGSVL